MLPQKITKELVIASLISETTRLNLQTLLDQAKSIRHDRDALAANYDLLLKIRSIWDYLDKKRKEEDKTEKEIIAIRKEGYEEIMNPIAELLEATDPFISQLNTELLLEEREIGQTIKKQVGDRDSLAEFINDTIRSIVAAPDNKELVRLQKAIGSEKSHKNKYGEYASVLEDVVNDLLKLIDGRKKLIHETGLLEERMKQAIANNDKPAMVQIKELMDLGKQELDENASSISGSAFKKVSELPIAGYDVVSKAVKPRTHRWAWRVDDIEIMYKKTPELVVKEANVKAVNAFMKEKVESGELDEYLENKFNGLVIYRKPFYVSVKTTTKDA